MGFCAGVDGGLAFCGLCGDERLWVLCVGEWGERRWDLGGVNVYGLRVEHLRVLWRVNVCGFCL